MNSWMDRLTRLELFILDRSRLTQTLSNFFGIWTGSIITLPSNASTTALLKIPTLPRKWGALVCKRWKMVIENINFNKQKSLILMDYPQTATFREALTQRFFGEIDLNTFAYLKLKRTRDPEAVGQFRALLLRLFPVISQLVISFWTVSDPAFVFNLWPADQLTTLSLNMNRALMANYRMGQMLHQWIISFTHLKRLDLDTFPVKVDNLELNLVRLEHLSCSNSSVDSLHCQWISFLSRFIDNANCTRFWNQTVKSNCAEVVGWNRDSGDWLNRLTHLALFVNSSVEHVVDYLSGEASSLCVLHLKHTVTNCNIFTLNSTTIRYIARLVHLMELVLNWVAVNLPSLELAAQHHQLATLEHIRIFRLTIYRIDGTTNHEAVNCSDRLMRTLSMIVPNVEQLSIAYYCADQLGHIELYLMDRFASLREHDFVHRE